MVQLSDSRARKDVNFCEERNMQRALKKLFEHANISRKILFENKKNARRLANMIRVAITGKAFRTYSIAFLEVLDVVEKPDPACRYYGIRIAYRRKDAPLCHIITIPINAIRVLLCS